MVEAEEETAVSCRDRVQQEAQLLMVNRLAAAGTGHLITEMVLQRQERQMGAYLSLDPFAWRGVPLTAANLKGMEERRRPE